MRRPGREHTETIMACSPANTHATKWPRPGKHQASCFPHSKSPDGSLIEAKSQVSDVDIKRTESVVAALCFVLDTHTHTIYTDTSLSHEDYFPDSIFPSVLHLQWSSFLSSLRPSKSKPTASIFFSTSQVSSNQASFPFPVVSMKMKTLPTLLLLIKDGVDIQGAFVE